MQTFLGCTALQSEGAMTKALVAAPLFVVAQGATTCLTAAEHDLEDTQGWQDANKNFAPVRFKPLSQQIGHIARPSACRGVSCLCSATLPRVCDRMLRSAIDPGR
eukprot:365561-Chlamydomonas_euryale.AAC.1